MPAVSVVIPSRRGGRYLRESVESVRAQTFTDWECVIVADGCEEDLSDIERADARVRIFTQRQRGVAIARNVGIGHAHADLIALLDDDDRMLPDRLLAQFEAMKDEGVGLCHTQFRFIDADGAVIRPGGSRETQYADFLRSDGSFLLSSTMVRKSLIQAVGGFNSLLPMGEDLDLVYRIARETTLRFLPDVLVEYRSHGDNMWLNTAASSGDEVKSFLLQHRVMAQARGEEENLRAIREGIRHVMSSRTEFALHRAVAARARRDYFAMVTAVMQAIAHSPLVTLRVITREQRRTRRERTTIKP